MDYNLDALNEMKSFMKSHNGDEKFDMSKQLTSSMSIQQQAPDQYENKLHNINGGASE